MMAKKNSKYRKLIFLKNFHISIFTILLVILSLTAILILTRKTRSLLQTTGKAVTDQPLVVAKPEKYSQKIDYSWETIQKGETKVTNISEIDQEKGSVQKIAVNEIGEGIKYPISPPENKPVILHLDVKIDQGEVILSVGERKRSLDSRNWENITLLIPKFDEASEKAIFLTSTLPSTSFSLGQVMLEELDMTGHQLSESYNLPTPEETITPTPYSSNNDIQNQEIPVKINMSLQVVANHCTEESRDTMINPITNRCILVENLAKTDLAKLQRSFGGTGKTFTFAGFDEPWDQTEEQGCGRAGGKQTVPKNDCNHPKDSLYITIIYPGESDNSGGEAPFSARYTAPSRIGEKDYWINNDGHGYSSYYVLVHEAGHLFGQIHTPWVPGEQNYIFMGVEYPLFYSGDLEETQDDAKRRWALEITKRSKLGSAISISNQVPKNLSVKFLDPEGAGLSGTYKIYGAQNANWVMGAQSLNEDISDGILENQTIALPGKFLTDYTFLFFEINNGTQDYYAWLSLMDGNFSYWNNNVEKAEYTLTASPIPKNVEVKGPYITINVMSEYDLFPGEQVVIELVEKNGFEEYARTLTRIQKTFTKNQSYSFKFPGLKEDKKYQSFVYVTSPDAHIIKEGIIKNASDCSGTIGKYMNYQSCLFSSFSEVNYVITKNIPPTPDPSIYPADKVIQGTIKTPVGTKRIPFIAVNLYNQSGQPKQVIFTNTEIDELYPYVFSENLSPSEEYRLLAFITSSDEKYDIKMLNCTNVYVSPSYPDEKYCIVKQGDRVDFEISAEEKR